VENSCQAACQATPLTHRSPEAHRTEAAVCVSCAVLLRLVARPETIVHVWSPLPTRAACRETSRRALSLRLPKSGTLPMCLRTPGARELIDSILCDFRRPRSLPSCTMLLFRLPLVAFVLLAALLHVATAAAADCAWAAWDHTYDFSSLSLKDLRGFDGGDSYTYYFRPCGTLQTVPSCVFDSVNASACLVVNPGYGVGERALGYFPPYGKAPKWGYIKDTHPELGVYYDIEGQSGCGSDNEVFVASAVFNCDRSNPPKPMTVEQFGCNWNFNLYTPLACLNSDRSMTVATE